MTHFARPSFVRRLIKEHAFQVKKGLGQNFLIDKNILDKIVAAAQLEKTDWVLEIGPGLGILTYAAALQAKFVLALEIDAALVAILEQILTKTNIKVQEGDALALDWEEVLKGAGWQQEPLKLVANLPYYLTTPLVMKALEGNLPWESIVVMVQKEVGQRMVAHPGSKDYGVFSLAVQFYARACIVAEVPRTVFMPVPNVDSAVVRLIPRETLPGADRGELFAVIRASFQQRRKTIKNALEPLRKEWGLDSEDLEQAFSKAGIDPSQRGERLSLQEFHQLTKALVKEV